MGFTVSHQKMVGEYVERQDRTRRTREQGWGTLAGPDGRLGPWGYGHGGAELGRALRRRVCVSPGPLAPRLAARGPAARPWGGGPRQPACAPGGDAAEAPFGGSRRGVGGRPSWLGGLGGPGGGVGGPDRRGSGWARGCAGGALPGPNVPRRCGRMPSRSDEFTSSLSSVGQGTQRPGSL